MAESKDASNFISFFSIVASQVSSKKEPQYSNSGISNDNLEYVQNNCTESQDMTQIYRTVRSRDPSCKVNLLESSSINPPVELRVSDNIYKKLYPIEKSKSILSIGGINFEGLSHLSENFDIQDYTNNSLKESVEKMHSAAPSSTEGVPNSNTKDTNQFKSGNKLTLVLRKLREGPGGTVA